MHRQSCSEQMFYALGRLEWCNAAFPSQKNLGLRKQSISMVKSRMPTIVQWHHTNFDSLSLCTFLFIQVQYPREVPCFPASILGIFLILFQRSFVDHTRDIEKRTP